MKLSNTSQRRVIIEELRKLTCHPTADELYDIVRKRLPRISLGTVYRNLELLSENGNILKLQVSGLQKRFDGCTDRHYHLRCDICGAVEDIELSSLKEIERRLKKIINTNSVKDYSLEFIGYCAKCRERKGEKIDA